MNADLELCQELQGHEKAVRCICVLKNGFIATGGVDALVCLFKPVLGEDGKSVKHFDLDKRLHHHSDFVYAICDSADIKDKYFYTGGKEKTIFKIDLDSGTRMLTFQGHEGAVCSLVEQQAHLYSGSWDGTCRVWDILTGGMVRKIDAGTHAVTLCLLPTGEIATGSQDAKIKIFQNGADQPKTTLEGHTDIVRRILFNTDSTSLVSCSNDSQIKFWTLDGLEMAQLSGHESFIFDLALSENTATTERNKLLYSGSDDRLLKVWNLDNSQCLQSILHSNTIWGVSTLPNGDVVTACADGIVRIWTTDPVRFASDDLRSRQNSDAVSAAAEASKQGAGVPLDGVQDVSEMGSVRGKKNGEIKMFKTGRTIHAYSWNGVQWDLIGEVTGKPKTEYEGDQFFPKQGYDYVFDVEVGEGGKTAKLPYNEGDNQLVTAEKFCARENIHKSMIEQITAFLRQQTGTNSSAPTLGGAAGASAAGGSNSRSQPSSRPAAPTSAPTPSASSSGKPKMKHFPVDQPLFFDQGKLDAAKGKILEFNGEFAEDDTEKRMDSIELDHFNEGMGKVQNKSKSFRPVERDLIWKKCGSWPEEKLFPVVDVWRLYLLHPDSADIFKGTDRGYSYIAFILKTLKTNLKSPLGISCARWLANVFASFTARAVLFDKRGYLLEAIGELIASSSGDKVDWHKLVRVSLATTLMNLTMVFADRKELKGRSEMLDLLKLYAGKVLQNGTVAEDFEALYRVLVGMGNVLYDSSVSLKYDFQTKLAASLQEISGKVTEPRIKEICAELLQVGPSVQGDDNGKIQI